MFFGPKTRCAEQRVLPTKADFKFRHNYTRNLFSLFCLIILLQSGPCLHSPVFTFKPRSQYIYYNSKLLDFLCCWPSTSRLPNWPPVFPISREDFSMQAAGFCLTNLNFLETSRCKFPCQMLAFCLLTYYKKFSFLKEFPWRSVGSNLRSSDPELNALPTELLIQLLQTLKSLKFIYYYQIIMFAKKEKQYRARFF